MTDNVNDVSVRDVLRGLYERDGKLTAESVLAEAQDVSSPIHSLFEWDDTIAAHEYRLEQARRVVRMTITTVEGETVRAFVHLRSVDSYAPIEDALATTDWRQEILDKFRRDAEAFAAKWSTHRLLGDAYREWLEQQIGA